VVPERSSCSGLDLGRVEEGGAEAEDFDKEHQGRQCVHEDLGERLNEAQ
jgi:hypothetical protein